MPSVPVGQELYPLSLHQMSRHWDEPGPPEGRERSVRGQEERQPAELPEQSSSSSGRDSSISGDGWHSLPTALRHQTRPTSNGPTHTTRRSVTSLSYLKTESNDILQEISDPRTRLRLRPLLLHSRGTSLITLTRSTSYPSPTERT